MSTTTSILAPPARLLDAPAGWELRDYHDNRRERRRADAADLLAFATVLQLEGPRLLYSARRCMDLAADLLAASTRLGWDHNWRVFRYWAREVDRLERRDAKALRKREVRHAGP